MCLRTDTCNFVKYFIECDSTSLPLHANSTMIQLLCILYGALVELLVVYLSLLIIFILQLELLSILYAFFQDCLWVTPYGTKGMLSLACNRIAILLHNRTPNPFTPSSPLNPTVFLLRTDFRCNNAIVLKYVYARTLNGPINSTRKTIQCLSMSSFWHS